MAVNLAPLQELPPTPSLEVCHVVAVSHNGIIGSNGQLPWKIRDDMQLFKELTTGHVILMGRKTYEALGKPLPNRTNLVISRRMEPRDGIQIITDLHLALAHGASLEGTGTGKRLCIIGGGEIYRQTLGACNRLYISRVEADVAGDTQYPALGPEWQMIHTERVEASDRNQYAFSFEVYGRAKE